MTVTTRDRRALMVLGAAAVVMGIIYFWPAPAVETVGTSAGDVQTAAARLDRMRREAAQAGLREEMRNRAQADLATLEKRLIEAASAPQAQAQMMQLFRRVAQAQSPALEVRTTDFGGVRPFGDGYAQVLLGVSLECQIDQLVNLMADIAGQPELLAVEELHIAAANAKQKTVGVRMLVGGIVRSVILPSKGQPR